MRIFFSLLMVIICLSYSRNVDALVETEREQETLNDPVVEPAIIRGIVLIANENALLGAEAASKIKGFKSIGVKIPKGPLEKELETLAVNKLYSEELLVEIEKTITRYYYTHGDPFVLVTIPNQSPDTEVIQVVVYRAKIEKISIVCEREQSEKSVVRNLKAREGDEIDLSSLDRSLYLMNLNPFRRVDLVYSAGKEPGTTDLTFEVNDRRPYRVYAGFSNSGVATTERQRWMAGFTLGNVMNLDQILSFQYMTAYNPKDFQAYTGQYIIPFSTGQVLDFYGGYSTVTAELPFPNMRNLGESFQGSFRLGTPFWVSQGSVWKWFCGFDFKGTNNTLEFSELFTNVANVVYLTQACLGGSYKIERLNCSVNVDLEFDYSPGKWLPHQTDADYAALRPDAKNHWLVARAGVEYTQSLPKGCEFYFYGRGQLSSQNLLPIEQIGLGGPTTVRGYTERQLNYDSGLLGTVEFHSPKLPMFSAIRKLKMRDTIYFLLFSDTGYGSNHNLLPGEPNSDYLSSAGLGIRYAYHPYVNAGLDWGIKLHQGGLFIGGGSMVNFNMNVSY
jgi:hemolysin activation/secretion protein